LVLFDEILLFLIFLGGKPGLAYYLAGCVDDKLMYLDPHFVQVPQERFGFLTFLN